MSVQINTLSKLYGQQKALDSISFEVKPGEILGYLGPNGAGKSTTMKIITGYIPPDEGQVLVHGMDVDKKPLEVKKCIGYLPENNPLYLDMYVHEYLRFVGGMWPGLKAVKQRVAEIIDTCGLGLEQNKRISQLSKGYRQRVGLAQALLPDPPVLILDEPTSGLDPNQIQEIRDLIKRISAEKTVIFSTHIMQEVKAICSRVVILNKGKVVADSPIAELDNLSSGGDYVLIEFAESLDQNTFDHLDFVEKLEFLSPNKIKIFPKEGVTIRKEMMRFATERDLDIKHLEMGSGNLEEIFSELTKSKD